MKEKKVTELLNKIAQSSESINISSKYAIEYKLENSGKNKKIIEKHIEKAIEEKSKLDKSFNELMKIRDISKDIE